jgi:hypothetical protein
MGLEGTLHNGVMCSLNHILYHNWPSLVQSPSIIIVMNVWNGIGVMDIVQSTFVRPAKFTSHFFFWIVIVQEWKRPTCWNGWFGGGGGTLRFVYTGTLRGSNVELWYVWCRYIFLRSANRCPDLCMSWTKHNVKYLMLSAWIDTLKSSWAINQSVKIVFKTNILPSLYLSALTGAIYSLFTSV